VWPDESKTSNIYEWKFSEQNTMEALGIYEGPEYQSVLHVYYSGTLKKLVYDTKDDVIIYRLSLKPGTQYQFYVPRTPHLFGDEWRDYLEYEISFSNMSGEQCTLKTHQGFRHLDSGVKYAEKTVPYAVGVGRLSGYLIGTASVEIYGEQRQCIDVEIVARVGHKKVPTILPPCNACGESILDIPAWNVPMAKEVGGKPCIVVNPIFWD